jgi:predicted RNA-binding protein associated with RNAse of E/G family
MTDVKTTETDPMELVREARDYCPTRDEVEMGDGGQDLIDRLADELETALDAARLANEAFTTAIKQRDEARAALAGHP